MLDLNVDMKNHVKIGLWFLDKRKIPGEKTLEEYFAIREKGEILHEIRPTQFNRVVILKVKNRLWYLSAAADKNGQNYEELCFYEQTEKDIENALEYLRDTFGYKTATPSEGGKNEN